MTLKSKLQFEADNLDAQNGLLKDNTTGQIKPEQSREVSQDTIDQAYPDTLDLSSSVNTPYTLVFAGGEIRIFVDPDTEDFVLNLPVISDIKPTIKVFNIGTSGYKVRIVPNGTTINDLSEIPLYDGEIAYLNENGTIWKAALIEVPRVITISDSDSPYTAIIDRKYVTISCDTSSGAITVNLPTYVGSKSIVNIKNKSTATNDVTVDGDGSETIDGELTKAIQDFNNLTIQPCSTEWSIL